MRIQPQHHDGEGTDASLYAFMTSLGHEPPTTVHSLTELHHPASRDIASTVQRLRDRQIAPVTIPTKRPDWTLTLSLAVANLMILWVIAAMANAYLAGRL